MGFLRSVPRSASAIATEPVELLTINWKMIKRLQWLYPPTAHKFFLNLMGVTCDRLQRLTECFSEIKMQEDPSGLCNRSNFFKILDIEIQRSQSCCTNLSLCFIKLNFEDSGVDPDNLIKDRIFHFLGEIFSKEIRNWDTLHQYEKTNVCASHAANFF